jgi:hypothetical protein
MPVVEATREADTNAAATEVLVQYFTFSLT